jgi:hypothetical protein
MAPGRARGYLRDMTSYRLACLGPPLNDIGTRHGIATHVFDADDDRSAIDQAKRDHIEDLRASDHAELFRQLSDGHERSVLIWKGGNA